MKTLFKSSFDDLSYRELSSWVSVAILITMLFYYLNKLASLDSSGMLNSETHNQLLFLIVLVTIITQVIFQSVVALCKRFDADAKEDERDKLFNQKATQLASNFIFGFLALLILVVSQSDFLIEQLSINLRGLNPKDILLSVLVVGFGFSQLLHQLALAIYYRRGS